MDAASKRPVPMPDPDSLPFWQAAGEGRLVIQQCAACGQPSFPPRPVCRRCHGDELGWTAVSGEGEVSSYAVARMNFVSGFAAPYVAAWVRLREFPSVQLNADIVRCDAEAVHVGMPVEVCFENRGDGIAVPQFRPSASR